jgi:hypothetical protein
MEANEILHLGSRAGMTEEKPKRVRFSLELEMDLPEEMCEPDEDGDIICQEPDCCDTRLFKRMKHWFNDMQGEDPFNVEYYASTITVVKDD